MRIILLLLLLSTAGTATEQKLTQENLIGIYYGELRKGYSQYSEPIALRFYSGGLVIASKLPGEPYDLKSFEAQFSKDARARFDQGRYQLIGNNIEFNIVLERSRLYFKGSATINDKKVTVNWKITNMQTREELSLVSRKIWPPPEPAIAQQPDEEESDKPEVPNTNEEQVKEQETQESEEATVTEDEEDKEDVLNETKQASTDSSLEVYSASYRKHLDNNDLDAAALDMNNLGTTEFSAGNFEAALRNFSEALSIKTMLDDRVAMATLNNNMAVCHERMNQREAAIRKYRKAAALYKETGQSKNAARTMYQIALVEKNHLNQTEESEAMEKLIEYEKTLDDKQEISASYNNLAVNQFKQRNFQKALELLNQGIALDQELDYTPGLAIAYNNRGNVYFEMGDLSLSLEDYQESLRLKQEIGDRRSQAITLHNIANVYADQGKIDSAWAYYENSLDIAEQAEDITIMHANYKAMAGLMAEKDDCNDPLEYYKLYTSLRFQIDENKELRQLCEDREKYIDEQFKEHASLIEDLRSLEAQRTEDLFAINLLQEDMRKQQRQSELEIQTRQQEVELLSKDKELLETEKDKMASESQKKTIMLAGVGLVSLLALVLFLQARKSARQAKKDKKKIAEQKDLVEEKNQEIMDSIGYAKRLQDAILPPIPLMKELLPEHFLLYRPKDIVAGDFYWAEKVDQYVYFAVADCTGHGVPGAMVSVVCSNAMDRAVKEFKLRNTGEILDKVRELVIDTFKKSQDQVKDGMDVALCRYDTIRKTVQFSGANNPLWIVRKRKTGEEPTKKQLHSETHILDEVKADKQPVGQYEKLEPFRSSDVSVEPDDAIFLFSDGYADQFGGLKGKKLKLANLKKRVFQLSGEKIDRIEKSLDKEFDEWKGDFEQIDDVCILGVRF